MPEILKYKVVKWRTDYSITGKAAVLKERDTNVSVYAFDKKGNFVKLFTIKLSLKATMGIASGRGVEMSNGLSYWLINLRVPFHGFEFGYVTYQDCYFSAVRVENEAKAKDDAKSILNKLIINDVALANKVNYFNGLLTLAERKGINVEAQRAKLKEIVSSWQTRQMQIKTFPGIQVNGVKQIAGIGIIPILVGVAIGAAAVITGFIVYYFLKPEYNTSQLHSKYLAENEAALKALLGEKGFEELKKNVDTEIKENAKDAYSEGKGEGTMRILKPIAIGLAAVFLFKKMSEHGTRSAA